MSLFYEDSSALNQLKIDLASRELIRNMGFTEDSLKAVRSNKIRSRLFKKHSKALEPDIKYVTKYREFLNEQYIIQLKRELNASERQYVSRSNRPTYSGIGFASGNLRKNIKAITRVSIGRGKPGSITIDYAVSPEFTHAVYGYSLAEKRTAKEVTVVPIMKWIYQKIDNGTFRIGKKDRDSFEPKSKNERNRKKETKKNTAKQVQGIAYAIATSLSKKSRPPVLKDWYKMDKNKRLNIRFKKAISKKGSYLRTQIKRSVIRNIKKQR